LENKEKEFEVNLQQKKTFEPSKAKIKNKKSIS
jgi:hypothetical protein